MEIADNNAPPIFNAVSSSTRQLYLLLRCISFAPKAEVQIRKEGLRFAVEESRVMQGLVFLRKDLFTSYMYNAPPTHGTEEETQEEEEDTSPTFQISLSSLLETLQIFGVNETKDRWASRDTPYGGDASRAFENRVLGMTGVCRISYTAEGDPLCIVLEESGVTTTCELVTYEPEDRDDIPLQREALAQKIIMRASWLHDAITELASTSPTRLTIVAAPTAPFFTLSSTGPLGSATVEFTNDPQLLETFHVPKRTANTYKFSLVKGASRAMAVASKVSIRSDEQGVLSLQFMIEVQDGGVSFVDFRFVPYIDEEVEGDEEEDDGEGDGDGDGDGSDAFD